MTTNNRMELMAAISALNALKEPCEVDLFTDSAYLCRAFSENWVTNWQRNGWKTSGKRKWKTVTCGSCLLHIHTNTASAGTR